MLCAGVWEGGDSVPSDSTGLTKCGPLKPLSSPSLDVSEELPSPCPVQTLGEGRVLSEHPLVKGECHMSCHVTHVVSTKPRPPAARHEWLVGWGTLFV